MYTGEILLGGDHGLRLYYSTGALGTIHPHCQAWSTPYYQEGLC